MPDEPPPARPRDPADDDTHAFGRAEVSPEDRPGSTDQTQFDQPPMPEFTAEQRREIEEGLEPGPTTAVRRVMPLHDQPSHLVTRYLFPTERFRGEWKRHWVHLAWPIALGLGSTLGLGFLSGLLARWEEGGWLMWVLVLVWLGVMGWVGWQLADWHFDRFVLTNKRIMKVDGIITRNVAMMPLLRVTDMKYVQSPLARLLRYGTFVIESAGQEQALREVPHIPNPNEVYLQVVEEMYEPAAVEARMGGGGGESEEEEQRPGDS
jgi:membrane protein YdbS with pleckstrin-like domain